MLLYKNLFTPLTLLIIALIQISNIAQANTRDILLLSKINGPDKTTDAHIKEHLETLGFHVTTVNEDASPKTIKNAHLVIISSTISAKNLDPTWRYAPVRLLTWENDCLDDLAMTGKRHDVDFGEASKERYLWLVHAPHPISGGLPSGIVNVYKKQEAMSWGKPGLGATIIATLYGQPEKVAIFAYEKGTTMDYESIAPEKRVMVFLNNNTFDTLRPEGLTLFDEAIKWANQ